MAKPSLTELGGYPLTASLSNEDQLSAAANADAVAERGIVAADLSFPTGNTIWVVPLNAVAFRYRAVSGGNFLGASHDGAASAATNGSTSADMSPWYPCANCRFIHWSGSTGGIVIEYTMNGPQPQDQE